MSKKEVKKSKVKQVLKAIAEEPAEEVVETPMVVEDAPKAGDKQRDVVEGGANGYYVISNRGAIQAFVRKEAEAKEEAEKIGGTYKEVVK